MNVELLFERLGPRVAPALEDVFGKRDVCILATRVVIDVAAYFGIKVLPLPVQAVVYNAAFAAHVDEGDIDVRKWGPIDGSWSVGLGFGEGDEYGKWNGHLVAVSGAYFGDFSIRQAERGEQGIVLGTAVSGPLPLAADTWTYENVEGTRVEYRRILNGGYRNAPDWKEPSRRKRIVGDLIRKVR